MAPQTLRLDPDHAPVPRLTLDSGSTRRSWCLSSLGPSPSLNRKWYVTKLLIIADTHVPARAKDLPAELWAAVREADAVIHAGDWVVPELLDQMETRSNRLIGVYGNNDGAELRRRLPEIARVTLDGVRFAVIHETGGRTGRERRADAAFPETDVLVFGHSHIPWDTASPAGMRLLNPGSPTDRRSQPFCTYMTGAIESGSLASVTVHRLPPRTRGFLAGTRGG
jgi:uncharacterized protein